MRVVPLSGLTDVNFAVLISLRHVVDALPLRYSMYPTDYRPSVH